MRAPPSRTALRRILRECMIRVVLPCFHAADRVGAGWEFALRPHADSPRDRWGPRLRREADAAADGRPLSGACRGPKWMYSDDQETVSHALSCLEGIRWVQTGQVMTSRVLSDRLVVGRRDDPRPPAIRGPYRAAMRPASHSGGPAYGAAPASGIYQAEALVTASPKGQLRRVWGRTGRTARG